MTESLPEDLETIRKLLGIKIKILKTQLGGNSRIYVVDTKERIVVVKKYLGDTDRRIRSMTREIRALNFLKTNEVFQVPLLIESAKNDFMVIMEYIEGVKPKSNSQSMSAIVNFLESLKATYVCNPSFPSAIDGIESTRDLLVQIQTRILNLENQRISGELILEANKSFERLASMDYSRTKFDKTYSVSDLGVHNMIKKGNRIKFIDLEFFGSDSPIKVIGDFLLHPKNTYSDELNLKLWESLAPIYKIDEPAIAEYLPLAALKWALIVMRRLKPADTSTKVNSEKEFVDLAMQYLSMSRCTGEELLKKTVYCASVP
jgi:hypothetical protein